MSIASASVPGGADFGTRTPDSTCQPSLASVRATARPMPRLAPVISAVRAVIALAGGVLASLEVPRGRDGCSSRGSLAQQFVRRDRQLAHALPGGVIDRVCDCRSH